MASQLLCLAEPRKHHCRKFTKLASCRESDDELCITRFTAAYSSLNHVKLESDEEYVKGKRSKFKGRFEAREAAPRLGFWYLTSCVSYILRKARTFYNEFCCDALFDGDDSKRALGYDEVMLVDPYYSIPVTPFISLDGN